MTIHNVLNMTFGDRKLPNDRLYRDLEADGLALLARIPTTNPHYLLLRYMLQYAQMIRTDAGYSGSMTDGGARDLEAQIDIFVAGTIERVVPSAWKKYAAMLAPNTDPEYAEYLRLQNKFGK